MKHLRIVATHVFLLTAAALPAIAIDLDNLDAGRSYIHPSGPSRDLPTLGLDDPALGTYHNGATLECAQCHIMHASQQHPHDGPVLPGPVGAYPQDYTPSRKLLKAPDPVALCLTCHDGIAGIPDVVGYDVNGLTERSAGLFDLPGNANPRGHKLDYAVDTDPGWGLCMRCHFGSTQESASVSCLDCHNPHGNNRSRNLQWASYPGGEPQFGLFVRPGATGMARYERANVAYGTTNDAALREVTNMCIDCHHVLTGASYNDPDGNGFHNLHPSYDSERGDPNSIAQGLPRGTTDPQHWEDGTGAGFITTERLNFVNAGASDFTTCQVVGASTNGVFCLSCHKAHGGTRSFGLLWDPVSGVNGEGCDQCHNKTAQ